MHRNKYISKFEFWTEIEIINQESDQKNWNGNGYWWFELELICRCKRYSVSACITCCWNQKDEWWLRWVRWPNGKEGGLKWGETFEGKYKA